MSQNPSSGVGTAAASDLILLKQAVLAFRSGDKQTARDLLVEATEHNPDNELVWLWRASAARTRSEAYQAVVRVLDINPRNEKALAWIEKLRPEPPPAPTVAEQAEVAPAATPIPSAEPAPAADLVETREEETEHQESAQVEETQAQPLSDATPAESAEESVPEQSYARPDVEDEDTVIVPVAESTASDDAEERLAALEAEASSHEQIIDAEAESRHSINGYSWGAAEDAETDAFAPADESGDDLLAALAQARAAVPRVEADEESDDDPLRALLESHRRADFESPAEDVHQRAFDEAVASVEEESAQGESPTYASRVYDADAENDVWESLGMAGMEHQPLPKASSDDLAQAGASSTLEDGEVEENPACFICEKYAQPQDGVCSSCRAIVDLELLDYTPRHEGAERSQLLRALDRLREQIEKKPTAKLYVQAALTSLNLRQSQQALLYLREACRLRPHDRRLVGYYDQLEKRPLILAVDDSKTVQKMISTVLEKESYRVVQAEDGLSAIAKLDEEMPRLILLDITMPRMDGYQVCKVINGNDATKHIPVIMLSGKDGFFDKVRGKMVGASNYITKPFDPAELTKTIAKFIKN